MMKSIHSKRNIKMFINVRKNMVKSSVLTIISFYNVPEVCGQNEVTAEDMMRHKRFVHEDGEHGDEARVVFHGKGNRILP